MLLKELKKGDFFTLKKIEYPNENQVFIKGEFERSEKKYICVKFSDSSDDRLISGNKEIFTDFIF